MKTGKERFTMKEEIKNLIEDIEELVLFSNDIVRLKGAICTLIELMKEGEKNE